MSTPKFVRTITLYNDIDYIVAGTLNDVSNLSEYLDRYRRVVEQEIGLDMPSGAELERLKNLLKSMEPDLARILVAIENLRLQTEKFHGIKSDIRSAIEDFEATPLEVQDEGSDGISV